MPMIEIYVDGEIVNTQLVLLIVAFCLSIKEKWTPTKST